MEHKNVFYQYIYKRKETRLHLYLKDQDCTESTSLISNTIPSLSDSSGRFPSASLCAPNPWFT